MNDQSRVFNRNHAEERGCDTLTEIPGFSRTPTAEVTSAGPTDANTAYSLHTVIIYQDEQTRSWAKEVCLKATELVGQEQLKAKWWKIDELMDPLALAEAVFMSKRSDLIIVAIRTGQVLPRIFHVWASLWVPNTSRECAVVALLGVAPRDCDEAAETLRFLKTVSQQGGIELLIEKRQLTGSAGFSAPDPACDRRGLVAVPVAGRRQIASPIREWGINE